MAVANNLIQYRKIQQKRIKKLEQGKRRGPITAAKYMVLQLRANAPRLSGRLLGTIQRRKNTVEAGGTSPEGFPYIHWINATPGSGLERVAYMKRWTGDERKYLYSQAMRKTGQPGFFWIAARKARTFYKDAMLRNTRSALKAQF